MQKILTFILALSISLVVSAGDNVTYHTDEVENGYDFVLYTPDSVETSMPLVIALHSRSASGNNLRNVDYFGTIDAIRSGMKLNAYVLAPQAQGDKWTPEMIMKDVEYVIEKCAVDTNRISAIGMSMGGNGVADLVAAYPDRIASAIILAGGLTQGEPAELSKVPLWVIRGLNDRQEAITRTDKMVDDVRKVDSSRIVYSKVKGLDHRQHERILYMPVFYEWLLSHNLQNLNRPVNTTVDVTAKMLNDAYKGLNLREDSAARRKSHKRPQMGPRHPLRW